MVVPTFTLEEADQPQVREAFDRVGAVRFPGAATPDEVAALRQAWQELSDRFVAEGRDKVYGIPIKYGTRADGQRYVQRFAFASVFSEVIRDFVHDPRFEGVRRLCGAEARVGDREKDGVVINCYRNEPGSRYKALGWHTDGLRDIFYGRKLEPMYNVGFYLDDSPVEKGALRILPGSHNQGLWDTLFRKRYFIDHSDDPDELLVTAEAGDLTVHDGRLWHRVAPALVEGEASLRRTMYVPYLEGPVQLKDESSPTPFYHHFQRITG